MSSVAATSAITASGISTSVKPNACRAAIQSLTWPGLLLSRRQSPKENYECKSTQDDSDFSERNVCQNQVPARIAVRIS